MDPIWIASARVMTTALGDGLALLNLETSEYYSLNDVGAFVWNELRSPRPRGALIKAVTERYEVSEDVCARDVDQLLEELRNASLAEPRRAAAE